MPRLPVPKPNGMFPTSKMSEIPVDEVGDVCVGGKAELVHKMSQQDLLKQQKIQANASASSQIVANSSSSSSSTTTTSRVAKTSSSSSSARLHHVSTELKASSMKSDLSELKSSISEMKNLSSMGFGMKDEGVDGPEPVVGSPEPLVTFPPDGETPPPLCSPPLCSPPLCSPPLCSPPLCPPQQTASDSLKYESTRHSSQMKTKQWAENFSAEQQSADKAESKMVQSGELLYQENLAASQLRARLDMDGVSAEKSLNKVQEQRSLKTGEVRQQESQNLSAATMRLQTESYSAEKKAMAAQQQRQTISSSSGVMNQEKHVTQSNITFTKKSSIVQSTSQMSQLVNGQMIAMTLNEDEFLDQNFDDLQKFNAESTPQEVDRIIHKYANFMSGAMEAVKRSGGGARAAGLLDKVNEMVRTAWSVPRHGHALGSSLCNVLRSSGALNLLLSQCTADDHLLQFSSAKLLEQCLTTENRDHVVEHGLEKVVTTACLCTKNPNSVDHSRVGTGILEHLFKHSEGTCSDVIRLGGLDAVLFECRKNDIETLRHCAGALANLSLYGGADNQEAMIKRKVPMWLFPLAFHNDDNIKYYACLAIAVLVANSEIEAAVLKSGTLDLVEPFVTSHNPSDFAKSNLAHAHGQSKHWLQRLVPVLSSKREEARNLAAFHFCMEAGIKKHQGNTEIFREIGAIDPLKKVASSPNAVASKYAAQALRLIGEQVPHKLSQQVPLWSVEDVKEWVKQIGFAEYTIKFEHSRVDGDLLLQLTEGNLTHDLDITNGIRRKRFLRELQNLKKMADYSSRDISNLNAFLLNIGPEFSIFTYSMLNAGVDKDLLRMLTEDHLVNECGITNSIQRQKILDSIKAIENSLGSSSEENLDKNLDVFVSYRRSNGSQLASLLKVHLQLRGFSVFIDVERLEAGKFDNNLLQSIRQARNFLLVLTPNALERCINDSDCKDWVHREIVAALQSQCNIIPITDNFEWPTAEELPEDMRAVCHFNGIRWIHDYQDACVDKLERFLRGELNNSVGRSVEVARERRAGEVTTPGTPSRTHNYQRLHSNLSSQDGSDKD